MFFSRGITLIEIIITIFVLSVGLIAILQMLPLGTYLMKSGEMATKAAQLGQGRMEEEISNGYDNISVGVVTEDYGEIADFSSFKIVTTVDCLRASDLSVASCDYDPAGDPHPMKKIEVTVYWKNPLGLAEKNLNLFSLISKK